MLFVVMVALQPNRHSASGPDSPAIGKPGPRMDLVRLASNPLEGRVDTLRRGEVALIHFWGTWCGPCKMEYPELAEMVKDLEQNEKFRFLSVSCEAGRGETFEVLRQKTEDYFSSEGIAGAVYADPQGTTRLSTAQRLGRNEMFYPTSIVVDADGNIAGVWEGYAPGSVDEMKLLVKRLLAEQVASAT